MVLICNIYRFVEIKQLGIIFKSFRATRVEAFSEDVPMKKRLVLLKIMNFLIKIIITHLKT